MTDEWLKNCWCDVLRRAVSPRRRDDPAREGDCRRPLSGCGSSPPAARPAHHPCGTARLKRTPPQREFWKVRQTPRTAGTVRAASAWLPPLLLREWPPKAAPRSWPPTIRPASHLKGHHQRAPVHEKGTPERKIFAGALFQTPRQNPHPPTLLRRGGWRRAASRRPAAAPSSAQETQTRRCASTCPRSSSLFPPPRLSVHVLLSQPPSLAVCCCALRGVVLPRSFPIPTRPRAGCALHRPPPRSPTLHPNSFFPHPPLHPARWDRPRRH